MSINEQEPLMNSKECHDTERRNSWTWRKCFFIIFPVEVCTFLFVFAVYFHMQIYQQYYFQRIMKDRIRQFNNLSDMDDGNVSLDNICLNQDTVTNMSNKEVFLSGQRAVNNVGMITTLVSLVPSMVVALIVTPFSDQYGRKPLFFFVFAGQAIGAVVSLLIVYFKLNIYYFLISSAVIGLSGGFGVVMAASFAYISDVTPTRWLTVRMGILEASIFVATATASASSDKWIAHAHCDFRPMVWLILATVLFGLIYSFVIPESVTSYTKETNKRTSGRSWKSLVRGLKIFTFPSYIGSLKLWKLWVATGIMVISMMNTACNQEIIGYFLHNKPLQWSYDTIGNYLAVTSVSHMLALIGLVPLFTLLRVPDAVVSFVGALFALGMNVFVALLNKTWEMFVVGVVIGMEAVITPGLRTLVAQLVKREDLGAAFSVIAAFQLLGTILATVLYNQLYTPQTTMGDHLRSPKLVYWVSAGLWAVAMILTISLVLFPEKKSSNVEELDNIQTKKKDEKLM